MKMIDALFAADAPQWKLPPSQRQLQRHKIPDLLTYPRRELSGFMSQERMRPGKRASDGDRGRSIRCAAAGGLQIAI